MHQDIHFISGLPRSGSTLLSAILRQNPRFSASMSSPLVTLLNAVQLKMNGGEFSMFFSDARRSEILRSIVDAYYRDGESKVSKEIIFDTNRTWTARAALTGALYPKSKIICCVRDIGWIIDSVESMFAKNPLQLSKIFNFHPGMSVSTRADSLMNTEKGLIGLAWNNLRDAWFSSAADRLIVVPYENLVVHPERTIGRLYDALGEPHFRHDLQNLNYDEPVFDGLLGMPGMHTVHKVLAERARIPCISPAFFTKYESTQFWKDPERNTRGVSIL